MHRCRAVLFYYNGELHQNCIKVASKLHHVCIKIASYDIITAIRTGIRECNILKESMALDQGRFWLTFPV